MPHCAKQVNMSIDGISTVNISGKILEIDVANLALAGGNSVFFSIQCLFISQYYLLIAGNVENEWKQGQKLQPNKSDREPMLSRLPTRKYNYESRWSKIASTRFLDEFSSITVTRMGC